MKPDAPSPAVGPVIEMLDVAVASAVEPDVALITGVTWSVKSCEYWVIGGLPGSGKSDLLGTAAGLLRPLRGMHRLFGEDLRELPEEEAIRKRLQVGLVFSNEGRLFTHLTVAENLSLPICYHRNCAALEAQDRVRAILETLGLREVAHQTPGRLPRNLRQRVALARALALDPKVLLLDDPLRAVDPVESKWWLEWLERLCSGHALMQGCQITLVVATENLRPWLSQANQFALVNRGHWKTIGGRDQLGEQSDPLLQNLAAMGS